jgi:enoyl-CoA hydratase
MLIGTETLDATAAVRCGLASRLGDRGAALAWARELAGLAPLSLAYAKKAINQPDRAGLGKDFDACWASDDAAEGQRARAAKRPPRFRGR